MKQLAHNERGVTMAELLVAMTMLGTALAAMFGLYRYQMFGLIAQTTQLNTQEAGRGVMDLFTRELRQAGADPTQVGIAALTTGSATSLQMQFDRNGNGAIDNGERVTYQLTDGSLTRAASGGAPTVFATGLPTTTPFTYYDGNGNQLAPGGAQNILTAAQLASVRRVRLAFTVQQPNPDPNNTAPLETSYSTNVDLRNRWMR